MSVRAHAASQCVTCAEPVIAPKQLIQWLGLIVLACWGSPEALRGDALIHTEVALQLLPCHLKLLICNSKQHLRVARQHCSCTIMCRHNLE